MHKSIPELSAHVYLRIALSLLCLLSVPVYGQGTDTRLESSEKHLIPVGGGKIGPDIIEEILRLSKKDDPDVLIIPQAAREDGIASSAQRFEKAFRSAGATRVSVLDLSDVPQALEMIEQSDVIWMPGGSQGRLHKALKAAGVTEALRRKYNSGAVVGGTSAGASIQSEVMMLRSSRDKESGKLIPTLSKGLGLWPEVIIDQHFSERTRLERLETAVLQHPDLLGIGLDERTAVVYDGENSFRVLGEGTVTVLHSEHAQASTALKKVILRRGDRYDVKERKFTKESTSVIRQGRGVFDFSGYAPLKDKPLRVFYYRPKGEVTQMPILFVMHGVLRNADTYRDNWIALADQYKMLVIVPEFSKEFFPGSRSYNFGNVRGKNGEQIDPEYWSYALLDPVFNEVVKQTGSKAAGYDLFGHSAGSQFVHRFLLLTRNTRANRIVAANAGSYMMPTMDVSFPYGLKNTPVDQEHLREVFAKKVIVQLGEADTSRTERYLPKGDAAMKQGAFRLERGEKFYKMAQDLARKQASPFNWTLRRVPGVGHDNGKMAIDAARALYGR